MQKYDAQLLAQNLNALCDVYDKKPVSLKALEVWYDTLKEFPTQHVMDAVIGWPKWNNKFPTPAEVFKQVNERSVRDREATARTEKQEFHPGVGGAKAAEFLEKMRKILKRPAFTAQQHWERVLATAPKGSIGYQYAEEVLNRKKKYEREPGEDDQAVNF
jgi:hypothetical protein